jgi:oligopeptide/dipeptide ABC transporter ATP-binding protein
VDLSQLGGKVASSEPDPPLLRTERLLVEFATPDGPVRAVRGVTFDLRRGETLGVVGESGSGKSVLLRSIMGLWRPQVATRHGSVQFDGRELVGLPRRHLRKLWGAEISIVFQDPMTSLNPVMRIGRQIAESVRSGHNGRDIDARKRSLELLDMVGIPEAARRLRQFPHELSGGMRQRVAIAMAIAGGPRLLLADEPTTALDVTVQAQILDLLADLQTELQMAMILVSHDLGVVATRTDRIIVMYAGQIVESAPTLSLFDSTRAPYTEALMRSIPTTGQARHARLYTIGGRPPSLAHPPLGCQFAPRCPYVQAKCETEMPKLTVGGVGDHAYRCWYPVGAASERRDAPLVHVATRPGATNESVPEAPEGRA